jgi:hypothetical protein
MKSVVKTKEKRKSFAIESREIRKELGTIQMGMMPKIFSQATLPHKEQNGSVFSRENGNLKITMTALDGHKLPFGVLPRLFLAFITAEAKKTGSRTLHLGNSNRELMRALGMTIGAGPNGSYTKLNEQIERLFNLALTLKYQDGVHSAFKNTLIFDSGMYDKNKAWTGTVKLSESFYKEISTSAIPVDYDAMKSFRSPLAMDIYVWLTHRMSYLQKETCVPWDDLMLQFGSDYKEKKTFKFHFKKKLIEVKKVFVSANTSITDAGLVIRPSRPHLSKTKTKKIH